MCQPPIHCHDEPPQNVSVAPVGTYERALVDSMAMNLYKEPLQKGELMRMIFAAALVAGMLAASSPSLAQDLTLERVLRTQVFNKVFEGFEYYYVTIQEIQAQSDGSREVTAVASGRFLDRVQRVKVLFLVVGEQVIGGQVLEGSGLPPCLAPEGSHSSL